MREYTVSWSIQVDAESAVDAAFEANMIMKDPDSRALFFEVVEEVPEGMTREFVDLNEGFI